MKNICKNIRHLRELRNLSQKYMAEMLNISQKSYSRIECDERITIQQLQEIAAILEVSVETIMKFDFNKIGGVEAAANPMPKGEENAGNEAELYSKIVAAKEDMIQSLKNEIAFLRSGKG